MALQPLNTFTTKAANFADKPSPGMTAAQVKAQFDAAPEELRVFVNSLITQLNADFALKSEIASALLGQILDGSLTDLKLSNTAGQVKDRLSKVITDLANFIATKGVANGLAPLDSSSKVPMANLSVQNANGVWADTTTTIPTGGTFTKTIPIGFSATSGKVSAYGLSGYGLMALVTTYSLDTISLSYAPGSSSIYYRNSIPQLSSASSFGTNIYVEDCYISGSNLVIVFKNSNGTAQTLSLLNLIWEVQK